ncbi:MAG: S1 RNA-binding domain-containing protein, partial [Patescibacteria group bacterium]
LTDIIGLEDFNGDMDFKVAGTAKGITALQLDVKTLNLTPAILGKALEQSKSARAEVLKVIVDAIKAPREVVSQYAPKIKQVKIPVEKIGEVVGSGGKTIKKIIAETGAQVDIEDDGSVNITSSDPVALQKAIEWVEGLVKEVKPGEIYEGTVVRIQPFGAFVEILPGKDGMVHVSDMGREEFVKDPNEVVKIGDKIQVRVKEVDDMHRINLSMNMDASKDKPKERREGGFGGPRRDFGPPRSSGFGGPRRSFGGPPRHDFGPRREGGFSRGPRRDSGNQDSRGGVPGGPHFPTSRLMDDTPKKDFSR